MRNILPALVLFGSALLVSLAALQLLLRMLEESGCVVKNFRQKPVVNCAGLLVLLAAMGGALVYAFAFPHRFAGYGMVLSLIFAASIFGLADDLLGGRDAEKGLRGHFHSLAQGRLTTGALKALGIGAAALLFTATRSPWPVALLDAALISFSVNFMNLLDLRPGRALKVFIVIATAFMALGKSAAAAWAAIGLAPAVTLLPGDLREKSMLGDVGSNALGAVIGVAFVINFDWMARLAVLIFLLGVHLFAERYSITEFISRTAVLRRLDEWGR